MINLHKIGQYVPEDIFLLARQWRLMWGHANRNLRYENGILYHSYHSDWQIFPIGNQPAWIRDAKKSLANGALPEFTSDMMEII